MAQFADYDKPPQDPNYLGYSKEFDVPRTTSRLASGISDITNLSVSGLNAIDEMNKNTIDKQLLAGVNQRRQEDIQTGLDLLSGTPQVYETNSDSSPDVPQALNQNLRRAAHITQANKMGRMGDELYYGDMQQISQNLISRYPGYERYINDRMAHWLGTNPANAQRAAILDTLKTQNAQSNSEENRWTSLIRQNYEHFSNPDGSFNQAMFDRARTAFGNPQAMAEVETYIARAQSRKQAITVQLSELELSNKRGTANENTALTAYRTASTEVLNKVLTQQAFTIGNMSFSNWRDVEEQIEQMKTAGGKADPENLALFGQAISRYQNQADAEMRKLAQDPRFMGLVQNPAKLAEIRNELLGTFKTLSDEVGAGNLRLATANINTFEGMSNNDALRAIRGNEYLRMWNQTRQTAGPGASVVIERMIATDRKLPTQIAEQLMHLNRLGIASGAVPDMSRVVSDFNTAHNITGPATPEQEAVRAQYLNNTLNLAKRLASDQDVPAVMRENAVRFLTSVGTLNFLSRLPREQQITAWSSIADPQTARALKANLTPAQWRDYSSWVQNSFRGLMATQIAQITATAQQGSPGLQFILDDNNRIAIDSSARPGRLARSRPDAGVDRPILRAIEDINLGLDTYANILKLDGKTLGPRELEALGINLQNPRSGGSTGSGRRSESTSDAPNGSEGPSRVTFSLIGSAQASEFPENSLVNNRIREGFRSVGDARTQYRQDSQDFIFGEDPQIKQQLLDRGRSNLEQAREEDTIPANARETMSRLNPFENPSRPGRPSGEGGGGAGISNNTTAENQIARINNALARSKEQTKGAPEKVQGAAIKDHNGKVYTGPTHFDILANNKKINLDKPVIDGFVTNTGRFVSREEAMRMIRKIEHRLTTRGRAGIASRRPYLISEDLD